jgi:acetolactate synthase-1/2/3 large subunit
MPAAIGAQLANKKSRIVVVDGDGSFRMNMGEIHTIGTLGIPIKILLLNNHSDGMVRNLEDFAYSGRHSATERNCDAVFAEMARICHFDFSRRITSREELKNAMTEFLNTEGPALLEIITDKEEVLYPVVRPGCSYADMDLGPYIKRVD